ncbi:DNA repair protein RecO [Candidatus Saccharibacteria bacterium]|nr:DNA repair protein RecO [Candidatus Saccharibacteria bacterium]
MSSGARGRNDVRTEAIVLHRVKYGETDRILTLITPKGKMACVAKGARREKSKLAGGIEMFTVSDVVIHESERSGMGMLVSAKMIKSYMNIIADLERFELGSKIIKMTNKFSESIDSPEMFTLINQCFFALDKNFNRELVEAYFLLNITRISGEEVNLHRDTDGKKLSEEEKYYWDSIEGALKKSGRGEITADHIKLMRIILTLPIKTVLAIKGVEKLIPEVLYIAKSVAKS